MAKRKTKNHQGKHKKELRNEPCKIELNQVEAQILAERVRISGKTQSQYLRYLLLDVPHQTLVEAQLPDRDFVGEIVLLGRRLNRVTHRTNTQMLAGETLAIPEGRVFKETIAKLEELIAEADSLIEPVVSRNVQKKFLLTLGEVERAKAKLQEKQLTLSRYMRQQITGVNEGKNNYIKKIVGQVGRLNNNVNQLLVQIYSEEHRHRLVIINQSTKQEIIHLQKVIDRAQNLLDL